MSVKLELPRSCASMKRRVPPWIRPELEMLEAMVIIAVTDLRMPSQRQGAIDWMLDEEATEEDIMSFPWVISALGLDLKETRKYVRLAISISDRCECNNQAPGTIQCNGKLGLGPRATRLQMAIDSPVGQNEQYAIDI